VLIGVRWRLPKTPSPPLGPPPDWDYWIEVIDRGIGMSADTVRNYFLKAGASYRQSDAWLRRFADEQGRSRVLRAGRFGVGAMSAFLLGDRIEVSTRHITDPRGLRFSASIGDTDITLWFDDRAEPGTTIRVRTDEDIVEYLLTGFRQSRCGF
jgi:HSP90 family molecular chaperone